VIINNSIIENIDIFSTGFSKYDLFLNNTIFRNFNLDKPNNFYIENDFFIENSYFQNIFLMRYLIKFLMKKEY
jgi:hypothetical protein